MTNERNNQVASGDPCIGNGASVSINGQAIALDDPTPTPRQLLQRSGFSPATEYLFLEWPSNGPTKSLGLDESLYLSVGENRFFAFKTDAAFFFTLDGVRYEWKKELTGEELRRVARVPENRQVRLDLKHKKDQLFPANEEVSLGDNGVERFYTVKKTWKLDVQGELITWNSPTISVRDALTQASFDPNKSWIITLKVNGQGKQKVKVDDIIDLTTPGIERLRVLKGEVNNGEAPPRRQFDLLPKDNAYLDRQNLYWETLCNGGRWLLLKSYPLPTGYNYSSCNIAISIPNQYPDAKLDMFFCDPPLALKNGRAIPRTESMQTIEGRSFQRWSRHPTAPWNPSEDSIRTHMALIDESINREVEA
ncbi:multiubiquitin domain-containing protein [Marinobacter sp. JSM 1782161]|uniref:multiubiquitin domain-containing protein n=1 Tax=Marinobacter sp. JSM 1782161 TaxID=2685906 RepID=UPI001402B09B|nr:multiubiquitin domain-containing protein [Marinobacter sp. JSM 1782161]